MGISITILPLSFNQAFIQYWLAQKKEDANIINLAGKQRMLSQRINLAFYQIVQDGSSTDGIKELYHEWSNAHTYLSTHSKAWSNVPIEYPIIKKDLRKLRPNISFVQSQIDRTVRGLPPDLDAITNNQDAFLSQMGAVVKKLEIASDKKLRFIIIIEVLLFLLSLAVLISEVFLIYIPISRSLIISNFRASKKNDLLHVVLKDVKQKNVELEQFTYIASHDLQEPLRTINGLAVFLKQKYSQHLDERGHRSLQYLTEATARMQKQIRGLLDYSILGREQKESVIVLEDMLQAILKDLVAQVEATKATIKWDSLPAIRGNQAEIRLLFQNLISNALKFQPPGQCPSVHITAAQNEQFWSFKVKDNGIGIQPRYQKKIFTMFHRTHARSKYNGVGIGLAHCYKIVHLHGGAIWIESKLNSGSIFHFTIKKP